MPQTKIVATIGPSTANADTLRALEAAGMNVARLNGSHGDLNWHETAIRLIRENLPEVPILLDLPGRKIRTGSLAVEVSFDLGDIVVFTADGGGDGDTRVPVSYRNLHENVEIGTTILAAEGTLRFTVVELRGSDILCRAELAGTLGSHKGVNIPGLPLETPLITNRDIELYKLACHHAVEFVAVSFTESASHVDNVRRLSEIETPRIVAKIEHKEAVENLDEIVEAADALMIDRGDLSLQIRFEAVGLLQKRIIETARAAGKPVIVATEMLHSMIEMPSPTQAEVSDITNAVIDGCSATMLSGETAVGRYPVKAVEVMRSIADTAYDFVRNHENGRLNDSSSAPKAVEDAIISICNSLPITSIVAITMSGYAARMLSSRRPRQPILAVSNDVMTARSLNLLAGVEGIYLDVPFPKHSTDHVVECLRALWQLGKLTKDDFVLVTGVGYPKTGNYMNLLQTHQVGDLIETLGWN